MEDKRTNRIYLQEVLSIVPRLLGLLDRNPLSNTYGCFDRDYWHYKYVDFACARKQEAVLTLTSLYKVNNKLNPYYKNPLLLQWINAALNYWCKIQQKNGSFNEWYPKENSFVATAFSSYAISEALLILKSKNMRVIKTLIKAGRWLLDKDEFRAINQEAGAALALFNTYLLTNYKNFKESAISKINLIIENQNKEGWFNEYGSADVGYLSLTVDYLSKFYIKSGYKRLLGTINKSIDFLSYFIHPNYTFGGEYGSRNTEYLIPSGFELMANKNKNASTIASHIRESIFLKKGVAIHSLDDRYLTYIIYNWLQAYLYSKRLKFNEPKYKSIFEKNFNQAGMLIKSNPYFYFIVNYKKGCPLKIFFKKNKNSLYDSGILIRYKKDNYSSEKVEKVIIKDDYINVFGKMCKIKQELLNPKKNVFVRGFQFTFGRNERLGLFIKNKLRNKLISDKEISAINFRRKIIFNKDVSIKIIDTISGIERIDKLILSSKYSHIYTPSSRYFQLAELNNKNLMYENKTLKDKRMVVVRKYSMNGKLLDIKLN
jgi:hypothetical protein